MTPRFVSVAETTLPVRKHSAAYSAASLNNLFNHPLP